MVTAGAVIALLVTAAEATTAGWVGLPTTDIRAAVKYGPEVDPE